MAEAELVKRFAALPESPRALGFAIGRSIFLEPARKWFAGQMSDEDAVATMRDCFLRLARAWNGRNRGSVFWGLLAPVPLGRGAASALRKGASAPLTRRGSFLLQGCGKRWEGIASLYAIQTKQNLLHPNPGRSAFPLRDARTKAL